MAKGYRQLWKDIYGPIPKDKNGRSYDIHHIDGNHRNNDVSNLKCVTIDEHLEIHKVQGDYLAVAAILKRMKKSTYEDSRNGGLEARDKNLGFHALSNKERLINCSKGGKAHKGLRWYNNGTQNKKFNTDPLSTEWVPGKIGRMGSTKGLILGTFWNNGKENKRSIIHPGDGWIKGKFLTIEQKKRRKEISSVKHTEDHNNKISIALQGRKQPTTHCPHCHKEGSVQTMNRWHFNNCKGR